MKTWLVSQLLPLVLPFALGQIATFVVTWLKRGIAALDRAPDTVKRTVLLAVSFLLGGLAHVVTTPGLLPNACVLGDAGQCLAALADPNAITVILTALVAHVLHKDAKDKTAGAAARSVGSFARPT